MVHTKKGNEPLVTSYYRYTLYVRETVNLHEQCIITLEQRVTVPSCLSFIDSFIRSETTALQRAALALLRSS